MTSQGDAEWAIADIQERIVGGVIVGAIVTDDNEAYGIQVKKDDNMFHCWIDCDPEGNGPGFMKIEEFKGE